MLDEEIRMECLRAAIAMSDQNQLGNAKMFYAWVTNTDGAKSASAPSVGGLAAITGPQEQPKGEA
jgi:hypothetical protein